MSSNSSLLIIYFVVVVGTAFLVSPTTATDHIVGANKGWNPGINYTSWANNQTFFVGDYISFRYKKLEHNVYEVNKTGYENCTTEGALGNWTNGKDFIHLTKPGKYYFICGLGGCSQGMKVSVVVRRLAPSPSASITEHSADSEKHSNSVDAVLLSKWLSLSLLIGSIIMYTV
ncbi:hypothetical protein RND81_09G127500 [Saponaria officinalis]|uniref:Phytocyanin domain-containing protein n=1 Tax=Saponaria officinalis TaxID=3572 RepID=A0AAW1ILA1_SAPOF